MQSLGMEYQIVRQVVTFLDQNIYNNITFVDVASHFNLSETQLKKLFREVTGYSVMQYYRKSVVGRIEYHIRQMDKNFTELADLFNFSSIHCFSKFYKRETGHTLREYLEKLAGREPAVAAENKTKPRPAVTTAGRGHLCCFVMILSLFFKDRSRFLPAAITGEYDENRTKKE